MQTIGWHYEAARERIDGLLRHADADDWATEVAACPGWRVHDVVAHLFGITEDAAAGRLRGVPSEAQTAEQVARHREDDPVTMLDRWAESGPFVAEAVTGLGAWPAAIDALTHEHDIRAALGRPGARDHESVLTVADVLARSLDVPQAMTLVLDGDRRTVAVGPGEPSPDASGPAGPDALTLRTSSFELVRLRLGRRSRAQVQALDWSGDPTAVLDALFVFGPTPVDLVE